MNSPAISAQPPVGCSRGWPALSAPVFITLVAMALFTIRLVAPPNLLDQDQERPAAYVLDAVNNGNWICQRDLSGDITSKPPLWTWLSAATTALCGRIGVFTLYLPGALGAAGCALLVWFFGKDRFGARGALVASMALMLCTAGLKWFGLARTDGVFAFTVTLTAFLCLRAWERGRGWTWVWIAAAAATLTKGPLGVVLASGGLLAAVWQGQPSENRLRVRGNHLPGVFLFLLIVGGWFLAAWLECGQALIDKMIGRELVGHAATGKHFPGTLIWQQPLYYLGRAAPWSLFAYCGLYRLWKAPSAAADERRFERFLFFWFCTGLLIFSLAPHQRADLLWPILPAGALLAGREIARLVDRIPEPRFSRWFGVLVIATVAGFGIYYIGFRGAQRVIRETVSLKAMAARIEQAGGSEFPLTHVDDPMTLQIYLNTLRPPVSARRAAQLLRGPEAVFVTVTDVSALRAQRLAGDPEWFHLLESARVSEGDGVTVVGNRPKLQPGSSWAFSFGDLVLKGQGVKLESATTRGFVLSPSGKSASCEVTNESRQPRLVRIRFNGEERLERVLNPAEQWKVAPKVIGQ